MELSLILCSSCLVFVSSLFRFCFALAVSYLILSPDNYLCFVYVLSSCGLCYLIELLYRCLASITPPPPFYSLPIVLLLVFVLMSFVFSSFLFIFCYYIDLTILALSYLVST
jgi:hypothetical protein